jgi:biopolymer transport protein ExbD
VILTQRLKPRVRLDLTPLIDVVFQLVIFFMISSVFNTAPGIELDLPDSTTSEAVEVTEIRITVAGSEEIYLNRELVALPNLGKTLREWSNQGRLTDDTAVLVEGGKAVPYETIITVLDEVRRGGVTAISLITAPITEVP